MVNGFLDLVIRGKKEEVEGVVNKFISENKEEFSVSTDKLITSVSNDIAEAALQMNGAWSKSLDEIKNEYPELKIKGNIIYRHDYAEFYSRSGSSEIVYIDKYNPYGDGIEIQEYEWWDKHDFFETDVNEDGTLCIKKFYRWDKEVIIPEEINGIKVTAIGDKAFYRNIKIEKLHISDNIQIIGKSVFSGCKNLVIYCSIDSPVKPIAEKAKVMVVTGNEDDSTLDIKKLYNYQVKGNTVTILQYKGEEVDVVVPEIIEGKAVVEIGKGAFSRVKGRWDISELLLNTVKLPETMEVIAEKAFYATELKNVNLPSKLKKIGDNAFANTQIDTIVIPESVTEVGEYFVGHICKKIVINSSNIDLKDNWFGDVKEIEINDDNKQFCINNNILYSQDKRIIWKGWNLSGTVTIDEYVKEIKSKAFNNNNIRCIDIKNQNVKICADSFAGNIISKIILKGDKDYEILIPQYVSNFFEQSSKKIKEKYEDYKLRDMWKRDWYRNIQDNIFSSVGMSCININVLDNNYAKAGIYGKIQIAYMRILSGYRLSDELFKKYKAYLKKNINCAMQMFVDANRIDAVKCISDLQLLNKDNIDECLIMCDKTNTEIKSYLMSYKSENVKGKSRTEKLKEALDEKPMTLSQYKKIWTLKEEDGKYIINGYKGTNKDIVIPAEICGKLVYKIGDEAFSPSHHKSQAMFYNSIESVVVSDGIKEIGDYAFSDCENMENIILPDSISVIGMQSFYETALTEVTLPVELNTLGAGAFSGCKKLNKVTYRARNLKKTNGSYPPFADCNVKELVIASNVKSAHESIFSWVGSEIIKVTILDGVKTIASNIFSKLVNITEIRFPASVNNIEEGIFHHLKKIKKIEFEEGNGTYEIKDGAIFNKTRKAMVHYMGTNSKFVIPEGTTRIGKNAFCGNCVLKEVIIPLSVVQISDFAFYNCSNLDTITLPETLVELGKCAFSNCEKLGEIEMPKLVEKIGEC